MRNSIQMLSLALLATMWVGCHSPAPTDPGGSSPSGTGGTGAGGGGGSGGSYSPPDLAPSCIANGQPTTSAFACCSNIEDGWGQCCSGNNCCAAFNHSHVGSNNECYCDSGYVWDSSATGDYLCVPAPAHVVDCTGQVKESAWCGCQAQDSNTGTLTQNGSCKPDPTFAPMQCCADPAYPASGACACFLSQPWRCSNFGNECYCDYYWSSSDAPYFVSSCNAGSDGAGNTWACCDDGSGSCVCRKNGSCTASERVVSSCGSDTALGYTPFGGCASTAISVASCG
jgi:hypothetical protein